MTHFGHVLNGEIVLDQPVALPEGATVHVEIVSVNQSLKSPLQSDGEIPSLLERLGGFVGALDGLPPDTSDNLDHYLYGAPKRS